MNTFAVNLSTVFTEVPFLQRFKKAEEAGFSLVECQFPYDADISAIQSKLNQHHLSMVLINLPAGDWENGERGIAIYEERREEFKQSVAKGIEYALALGVHRLHCLAGIINGQRNHQEAKDIYLQNLRYAARELQRYDLTLLIEPINTYDMPGYFLNDIKEALQIIKEIGMDNVKLQFDFYHIQTIQGDLLNTFSRYLQHIGHIQIADVPGRHQPGTGEINYQNVLNEISVQGYTGFIGLEYTPAGKSEESFGWLKDGNREV